jgi:uncharacterized repeat protein (TIGR01451 family)
MKKRILTLVLIIAAVQLLEAQGWRKIFGETEISERSEYIAKTPDGGFVVQTKTVATLYRLDKDGDVVWSYIALPEYSQLGKVVVDNAGFIYVEGFKMNQRWILKLDPSGSLVSVTNIGFYNLVNTTIDGLIFYAKPVSDSLSVRKYDFNGNLIWEKRSFITASIITFKTDHQGLMYFLTQASNAPNVLFAIGLDGNILWSKPLDNEKYGHFTFDQQGNIIVLGNENNYVPGQMHQFYLLKLSPAGEELWSTEYPLNDTDYVFNVYPLADGSYILQGYTAVVITNIKIRYYCLDSQGNELWKRIYNTVYGTYFREGVLTSDNSVVSSGYQHEEPFTYEGSTNMTVWKVTAEGLIAPNLYKGRIAGDVNGDCVVQPTEPGLKDWKVQINGLISVTDTSGRFDMMVDSGSFPVEVIPPGDYWSVCTGYENITFPGNFLLDTVEIPVYTLAECAQMEVNIGTPFLRFCFENTAHVSWTNYGTTPSPDTRILIVKPPEITINSSTWPVSQTNGDSLWFEIGLVNPYESGSFTLKLGMDCDFDLIGQALCLEAYIEPDTFCATDPNWSGAHITLSSRCVGDTLVQFTIKNDGSMPSDPALEYIITEDQVVLLSNPIPVLQPGEEIQLDQLVSTASLYRISADQEPFHPGLSMPYSWVEGCGSPGNLGFSLQYEVDDSDFFKDIDCHQVVSSLDPNDKTPMPAGYGAAHFIHPNTDITYRIRFQNTGTDTAFLVVIRDTLDPWLDPATVRPEAASNDYTWHIVDGHTVKFIFNAIALPDSFTNEPASHGFIQFRVSQKKDVPLNTVLHNKAAIYFDFNLPVITNETFHTIGEDFMLVEVSNPEENEPAYSVAPNPCKETAVFTFENPFTGNITIVDERSNVVWKELLAQQNMFFLHKTSLAPGVYFFEFSGINQPKMSGKIIIL